MAVFSGSIRTKFASKYLQQLCKHFAHKVTVQYDPETGRVAFPAGRCLMNADAETLSFYCRADDPRGVPVVKSILVNHIAKFAWREDLEVAWSEGAPAPIAAELAGPEFLPGETGGMSAP